MLFSFIFNKTEGYSCSKLDPLPSELSSPGGKPQNYFQLIYNIRKLSLNIVNYDPAR